MGMDWSDEPDPAYDPETGIDDGAFDSLDEDMLADSEPELTADGDESTDFDIDEVDDGDGTVTADVNDFDDGENDQPTPEPIESQDLPQEEVLGADPDSPAHSDDPGFIVEFPPELELDPRPEPVDGEPWSDSALLGGTEEPGAEWTGTAHDAASLDALLIMDGAGAESSWDNLLSSSDPAVSSLARWWQG